MPNDARVHYKEVYPGVDLIYYGNQHQLEYDFIVAPGSSPEAIRLAFDGARGLEISEDGELVVHLPGACPPIIVGRPVLYQQIGGVRREVSGHYARRGAREFGFEVAAYDHHAALVIDPIIVSYATYLGGADDVPGSIAVDAAGSAYITGSTKFREFPAAGIPAPSGKIEFNDIFVAKLNPSGTALVYTT